MLYKKICITLLSIAIILSGCGTANNADNQTKTLSSSDSGEWEVLKTIEDRKIIAELKQSTEDTHKRDEKVSQVVNMEYSSEDFAEELAIQGIEGMAAIEAFNEVYGGYEGVANAGVSFFEWKSGGAKQSGFWIGIKNPDKRLTELVSTLQKQVDAGEILAKHIYFYQSPHTEKEQNTLTSTVSSSLQRIGKLHDKPDRISAGVSVNTMTSVIEITHDFLTEDQKDILRNEFSDYEIEFKQDGKLVQGGDEPDITYPAEKTTTTPSTEGAYVVSVTNNGMMVVDATAMNFGATGGVNEFYSAISASFPDADKKLEVGQRVIVEYTGGIQESYPAQGRAKFVEVLPEYKPANAKRSESEIVREAIDIANEKSTWFPAIRSIHFDEQSKIWKLSIKQEDQVYDVEIND